MKTSILLALGLLAASSLPSVAMTAQQSTPQPMRPPASAPPMATPPSKADPMPAPMPMRPEARPAMKSDAMMSGDYGRWDSRWGQQPPPPPTGFMHAADWHRHVHACQQGYRSYDPHTDMFTSRAGHSLRCTR